MATALADPSVTYVRFTNKDAIAKELANLESIQDGHDVHLDLSHVNIVSSVELSVLIRFCLQMRAVDKHVVVTNVAPLVADVFRITKFGLLADVQ